MSIPQRLATNLRAFRLEKGWSQEEFAHEADIHRTYISDFAKARRPSIDIIEELANALSVKAGQIVD